MEQKPIKRYIVNCLSVSGIRKAIYTSGQVVTEHDFPEGQAEKYVASKHLRRYDSTQFKDEVLKDAKLEELNQVQLEDLAPPAEEPVKEEEQEETTQEPEKQEEPVKEDTPDYEAMSNKDLKALLDAKQIPYDSKANKKTLIDLLTGA